VCEEKPITEPLTRLPIPVAPHRVSLLPPSHCVRLRREDPQISFTLTRIGDTMNRGV